MSARPSFSDAFLAVFRHHAGASGTMPFERFMELALYHPSVGYYRQDGPRIGYGPGTDFFTASTSGPVFGSLVAAACVSLVGAENAHAFTFVELGAETPQGVLAGVAHPFGRTQLLHVGESIELSGRCIVFSNELFDAQPFRRYVFRETEWRELGVALRDGHLVEVELPPSNPPPQLPRTAADGYVIDAPLAAAALARQIAGQPWRGVFVAFDYGKSWREIVEACPAGTARAYYHHTQTNDLLAQPGEQDITCHVCWDWLVAGIAEKGFTESNLESQESFFIRRASDYIGAVSSAEAAHFSQKKLSLLQLLHPSHLGQKFQVLHAVRD